MDIETLLRKAEQNGCMVVLNDIAPNRERSELVFRVPESVYDTPVAALDIDESTKNALQKQKITVLENLLHRLAMGKNAAKQLHIAQDAAEQVVNAVIETAYRSLSEPEKRNFWERILHNTDGDACDDLKNSIQSDTGVYLCHPCTVCESRNHLFLVQ